MRINLAALAVVILLVFTSCQHSSVPKFEENWESLSKINKEPEWFKDSKLGIYFTWGPYTVPAYQSEWYPRWMYMSSQDTSWTEDAWRFPGSKGWGWSIYEHHVKTYGDPSVFGYHDFIPMFKAEKFDPSAWADLFVKAGAKFAGPCAQHHDGFAMWASKVNPWNAKDKGPKRDLLGDLFTEFKKRNLKTIATFHHARNMQRYATDTANRGGWDSHFPYHPKYATSSTDDTLKYLYGNIPANEFYNYWYEQVNEVIQNYAPDMLWYDNWMDFIPESYVQKMVAMHFNTALSRGQEPVVIYKKNDLPRNVGVLDLEQSGMREMSADYWMTDITLSFASWSYVEGQTYKPVDMLLRNMIDVWSKKGIVLLNVCPRADGIINDEQQKVLTQLGAWLTKYGEAVYGTRAHSIFGYGAAKIESGFEGIGQSATQQYSATDIRFTRSKDDKTLYVFFLGMPKPNAEVAVENVFKLVYEKIKKISVLGTGTQLAWHIEEHVEREVVISTPDASEMNEIATVFKIEFE